MSFDMISQVLGPLDAMNTFLDQYVVALADASGFLTLDKARYICCALATYPLAFLFRFIPNIPALKHLIGMIVGLWFGYFVFGAGMFHSVFTSIVVFLMVKLLPRNISHQATFAFALVYVCVSHVYRMYIDYLGWTLDFTGPQMLLTIKFTFYAFDVHDYRLNAEQLDKYAGPASTDPTKRNFLREYIVSARLPREPSALEYFGYIFFFPTFLAGPVQSVKSYMNYMDRTSFAEFGGSIPASSYAAAGKIFLYSLIWAPLTVVAGRLPVSYAASVEFLQHSFLYRIGYLWLSSSLTRGRYYFLWLLTEGANIIVGLGYNGKDKATGKLRWDASSNVRPIALETAMNLKEVTENWNLSADRWLRNYIYLRVHRSLAAYNTYITYVASAIWHGFYPGYYVAFVGSAVATELYREVFRKIRPRFLVTGKDGKPTESLLYRIVATPICSFILALLFVPFVELNFSIAWRAYGNSYYSLYVVLAVAFVLLKFVLRAPRSTAKATSTSATTPNGTAADTKTKKAE